MSQVFTPPHHNGAENGCGSAHDSSSCKSHKIPEIIHYCWFGDKSLDRSARNCIKSWKKYLPGYEIKCWDNSCLDKIDNKFVRDAIADKRWAFVADYVRLFALYNEGGIYFDTDVKLYSCIDALLNHDLVIPTQKSVATGFNLMSAVIAAIPRHPYLKTCLDYYSNLGYDPNDYRKVVINPIMSMILHDKWKYEYEDKCQELAGGIHILDRSYFGSSYDMGDRKPKDFYGVHFCNQSWIPSDRGRFYTFCKSNDLMGFYRLVASFARLFRNN